LSETTVGEEKKPYQINWLISSMIIRLN